MRILITGGHLSPALSVIDKLRNEEILYVGRKNAMEGESAFSFEYQVITALGIPFVSITTGRLQRKFTRYTLFSLFKLPFGFYQSVKVLKEFKPDVILGFGSYVSIPVIVAGFLFKIPVVIHEQTLEAGMANKIAGFFATKICLSWESSKKFFPVKKIIMTGNPLRKEIFEETKMEKEESPLIFITGGSLGSHFINELVRRSIEKLTKDFEVIHQTGDARKYNDFEKLTKLKNELGESGKHYTVKKFLTPDQSAKYLKIADIVIARAGINTVTELLFLGKPSLLIPLVISQNNEQQKNAQMLKTEGIGEILKQQETTPEGFIQKITDMFKNISTYQENGKKTQRLINKNAAAKVAEVVKNVYEEKKNQK